jgi:DDE superfamily endonuclease
MVPTLRTTLGLTGHRPIVGHMDGHDVVDVFGALNLVTGRLTTRLTARHRRTAQPSRPMQHTFARHVRDIARAYPMAQSPRVVLVIAHASWHKGSVVTAALNAAPPIELDRLPSDRPPLQGIERLWKVWRRRATPNRLFPRMAQLRQALRRSLCSDQTLKHRVLSLRQSSKNRTKLSTT